MLSTGKKQAPEPKSFVKEPTKEKVVFTGRSRNRLISYSRPAHNLGELDLSVDEKENATTELKASQIAPSPITSVPTVLPKSEISVPEPTHVEPAIVETVANAIVSTQLLPTMKRAQADVKDLSEQISELYRRKLIVEEQLKTERVLNRKAARGALANNTLNWTVVVVVIISLLLHLLVAAARSDESGCLGLPKSLCAYLYEDSYT
eukprot:Colp12_sorted_trinity150504_noHs@29970